MSDERVERRLAAILAGDVVGYSRLMGADEVGALRALKAVRRELANPAVAAYHGRIVKRTGFGSQLNTAALDTALASPFRPVYLRASRGATRCQTGESCIGARTEIRGF